MSKKDNVEGEGFVIKDKRSSQISEDDASSLDEQTSKDKEVSADEEKVEIEMIGNVDIVNKQ